MRPATPAYQAEESKLRGALSRLKLLLGESPQHTILDNEILTGGRIYSETAFFLNPIRKTVLAVQLDNRNGQWCPNGTYFLFSGTDWQNNLVEFYHGFEPPGQNPEWLLLFRGRLQEVENIGQAFEEQHQIRLVAVDDIWLKLQAKIGAPAADGTRQPYMHGPYRLKAEFQETSPAQASTVTKTGSGSATLVVYQPENYTGQEDTTYRLEAETTGEIGTATFKWSKDNGQTWEKKEVVTVTYGQPVLLEHGLRVYWIGGAGDDFVTGDTFTFTMTAARNRYLLPGAPFEEVTGIFWHDTELTDYDLNLQTGELNLKGLAGSVEARVVKDAMLHPVDIIADILTEVGLADYMDEASFSQAKMDTLEYSCGVCFENTAALDAVQALVSNFLYEFWIEFGQVKIRAYLGD